eukprot:6180199-Pleurochrysis_carterae.AAC.2
MALLGERLRVSDQRNARHRPYSRLPATRYALPLAVPPVALTALRFRERLSPPTTLRSAYAHSSAWPTSSRCEEITRLERRFPIFWLGSPSGAPYGGDMRRCAVAPSQDPTSTIPIFCEDLSAQLLRSLLRRSALLKSIQSHSPRACSALRITHKRGAGCGHEAPSIEGAAHSESADRAHTAVIYNMLSQMPEYLVLNSQ